MCVRKRSGKDVGVMLVHICMYTYLTQTRCSRTKPRLHAWDQLELGSINTGWREVNDYKNIICYKFFLEP